jgi:hypothetical protein
MQPSYTIRSPVPAVKRRRGAHRVARTTSVVAAAIMARRLEARRQHPECPYIFHRKGIRIGNFRREWKRACAATGVAGRMVDHLRRSGVKHPIGAGNDPHRHAVLRPPHAVDPRTRLPGCRIATRCEVGRAAECLPAASGEFCHTTLRTVFSHVRRG